MTLPAVIIPVFNAFEHLQKCLEALRDATPSAEVLLVDDASTDERVPALIESYAGDGTPWRSLRLPENRGFVHAVNTGISQTAGDVVLLNSDTEVTDGWLQALARCLASDPAIATATPWTNNGEIASLPGFCVANAPPADRNAVAAAIRGLGPPSYPDIPTAVGFCMAISRAALDRLGVFDEQTFGRGYGEENDYSMRAAAAGLRNVLCDDAYVVHHGGASFGPLGLRPDDASMQRLLARHPGYLDIVSRFIERDPLAPRRAALVAALERAGLLIR